MKLLLFSSFFLFATALVVGCMPRGQVSEQPPAASHLSSSDENDDAPASSPAVYDSSPDAALDPLQQDLAPGSGQSVLLAVEKPTDADPVNAGAVILPSAVAAGESIDFQVAVSLAPGWHIYGEQATTGPYPPTRLTLGLPEGFEEEGEPTSAADLVPTPQGPSYQHRDRAILIRKLRVPPEAKPGSYRIEATLEYQACNAARCLPPERLPLSASFEVTQRREEAPAP